MRDPAGFDAAEDDEPLDAAAAPRPIAGAAPPLAEDAPPSRDASLAEDEDPTEDETVSDPPERGFASLEEVERFRDEVAELLARREAELDRRERALSEQLASLDRERRSFRLAEQSSEEARRHREVAITAKEADFAHRLADQRIDPRKANIDWAAFRDAQREPSSEAVASALVLDQIAIRDDIGVSENEIDAELEKYSRRTGLTAPAVRARLEQEGGLERLVSGLRREKALSRVMDQAKIVDM